jgi:phosphatidylglycerol lysyltransferase
MTKNIASYLGPTLGAVMFLAALWVLHRELKLVHYPEIVDSLKQIPTTRFLAAVAATGLNYLVLTGYDWLAFRYIRRPLQYSKIALASFIGYAFSNGVGLSMLAGSSVRYRLYSSWGLSALEITKVVAFCTLTLWLGLFTVAGAVFILNPVSLPAWVHLPLASTRPLGGMLLLLPGIYLLSGMLKKKPLSIWELEIPFPPITLSLQQIALSGLDWLLAGYVLYILVAGSKGLSYPAFLSVYLLGQFSGLVSQVPGGLGVFESVVTIGLSPFLPTSSVLASLLAFRLIYYLLPLLAATLLLGLHELFEKRSTLERGMRALSRWIPHLAPRVFSSVVFIAGTILLLSGATPAVGWRMTLLRDLLPLSVVETSHFLGSLIGVILLLVARGLQLKLDGAYFLTVVLLGAGMVASLLKGFDFEEAIVLGVVLVALIPCRKHFYRKASLLNEPFTPAWIASVGAVLLTSLWITIFAHKHVDYSVDLWWTFAFSESVPRAVRATLGAVIVCLVVALSRLLRPVVPRILSTLADEEMESIERVVDLSPNTSARLALLGDKRFLLSPSRRSFIMYGVEGRSWVAMGDPVGERGEWEELAWQFREMCDRYGGWTVFYEVGKDSLPLYLDLGLTLFKIGEEGIVHLQTFSLEGKSRKGLRNTCNRMEKEGYCFEVLEAQAVPSMLPRLKEISDAWLREKNTREKRFSLGFFDPQYLKRFSLGIIRREQEILAFCNLWEGAARDELSVDLMRYSPGVPPETMEYLFIRLMLWGKEYGYHKFNLGMAPLSGLDGRSLAPTWSRLGALIYQHVEHFYNFKGLRQYKEKFDPVWEPRYIACPSGLILPRILTNIASLTSGGMKGVIAK